MKDSQKQYLEKCLDTIDDRIAREHSFDGICGALLLELKQGNFDDIEIMFNSYMPIPLKTYIKRRMLTEAYVKYREQKPKIDGRHSFCNIPNFICKFESEFLLPTFGEYARDELQPKLDVPDDTGKDAKCAKNPDKARLHMLIEEYEAGRVITADELGLDHSTTADVIMSVLRRMKFDL